MNRAHASLVLVGLPFAALTLACGEPDAPVVATPVASEEEALAAPPPVSGGTLLLTRDGRYAVAADPALDSVFVVDLDAREVVREVALERGDEPGRLVEGADGEVFVALRRGGAVARIAVADGSVARAAVCPAPRGIEYDADSAQLFVACAGGELATLNRELEQLSVLQLERDLRDVVYTLGKLVVTRFRSAEVLIVDPVEGRTEARTGPEQQYISPMLLRNFAPSVAWRMVKLPSGLVGVVHQRALLDPIPTGAPPVTGMSYYGGNCDQVIVHGAVTLVDPARPDQPVTAPGAGGVGTLVLPVDMAVSADGNRLAVVAAGSGQVFETSLTSVRDTDFLASCFPAPDQTLALVAGEPLAVAYNGQGQLVVQTRQPATIQVMYAGEVRATVALPGPTRRSVGHALFNRAASPMSPIACASCHPEGHEDGRAWSFQDVGLRRTQDVSGGVSMTKPFHWDGELADMHSFMSEVFVNRMGGVELPADRIDSLERWLDEVERLPASATSDGDAVARGEQLFLSDALACGSCHAGGNFTNNTTVDVGTGKPFQVPSLLGVWSRAPYMHDGCALTLRDRFVPGSCGGTELHGHTAQLSEAQVDDLVAYLETL